MTRIVVPLFICVLSSSSTETFEVPEIEESVQVAELFKNGDCVQNKWDEHIKYAVSGRSGERYRLTLIRDARPLAFLANFPDHSSTAFIGAMFKRIDCRWNRAAVGKEIYETEADWYGNFQRYKATIF